MGGDTITLSHNSSSEEVPSLEMEFPRQSLDSLTFLSENALIAKVDKGSIDGELCLLPKAGRPNSSGSVVLEASRRRERGIYREVWRSYEELLRRTGSLEETKSKILSYAPGSWTEQVAGIKLGDNHVPEMTTLLLIGPKGSGKSSLINKISRMLEEDKFLPERAQVSYHSSAGEGTCFLQEYLIPRGSHSFCLYDTRCLSDVPSENTKMFMRWMKLGVRNGELVKRASDRSNLKTIMKYKARDNGKLSGKIRMVHFVIMVVNGLAVLESIDSSDEGKKQYCQMIAREFNNPLLSFKDDKPVIVVTHGDLLALSDRVKVRVYLGELLGIPPKTQIFDIPDGNDLATELTIADLLCYCLEHADKNLHLKSSHMFKDYYSFFKMDIFLRGHLLLFMVVLGMGVIFSQIQKQVDSTSIRDTLADTPFDWNAIRHLWLGVDNDQ